MKNKILIISLADNFIDEVARLAADNLGLYYLNLDKYLDYTLQDPQKMLSSCGIEYLKKQERSVITDSFEFENTLYYASYELYSNNRDIFKGFKLIYPALAPRQLALLKEDNSALNAIAFEDRNYFLRQVAYTIEVNVLAKNNFMRGIISVIDRLENT